jgi:hypothetical protein
MVQRLLYDTVSNELCRYELERRGRQGEPLQPILIYYPSICLEGQENYKVKQSPQLRTEQSDVASTSICSVSVM